LTPYFLLRNNKQSGPYSLEQLKSLDLRPTDLLWNEAGNRVWRHPEELDELGAFFESMADSKEILHLSEAVAANPEAERLENGINVEVPASEMSEDKSPESTDDAGMQPGVPDPATLNGVEPASAGPIKVIIADDHSLFREGVKLALSHKKDIEIIGEADTGVHLLNLLKHHQPDVILLDIEMPVMDGITALKEIRKLYGNLKVIILSMHDARSMVTTLMKTGANSYLTKSADSTSIYMAIKGVHSNDFHYTDLSNKSMIESLKEPPKHVVKERSASNSAHKSDMMLKMRDMNKRHNVRMPSRKRRRKSMLLLIASVFTAVVVLGMFHLNDEAPKNKIMYAGGSPGSPVTQAVEPIGETHLQETVKSKVLNDLLREQDSIIQSRRFENAAPIEPAVPATTPAKPRKKARQPIKEMVREPEILQVTQPEKPEAEPVTPADSPVVKDKGLAKYQVRNQLSVAANDYGKGIFGGVHDIELTVTNKSTHFIDDVTIQLEYLLAGKKVHRATLLHVNDIPASSSKVITAPRNSRGISIQYWITDWSSKELE
jgi:DNA-binding NarL/FixJ family response regulator